MSVSLIILFTMYIFTDTSLATIHSNVSLRSGLVSVILSIIAVSRWRMVRGASSASMVTCQMLERPGSSLYRHTLSSLGYVLDPRVKSKTKHGEQDQKSIRAAYTEVIRLMSS